MKVASVSLIPYALPLVRALPGANSDLAERQGVLVRLELASGKVGWGDTAPYPGLSVETLAAAEAELQELIPAIQALAPFVETDPWSGGLLAPLADTRMSSSVRFGVETALCNAAALEWGQPWHRRLTGYYRPRILVQALLTGDHAQIRLEAEAARAAGFHAVKIKVGAADPASDIELVRMIREVLGDAVIIRLDANRAWSLDEALEFAGGVGDLRIDYIEEPVRDVGDLTIIAEQGGIPIALDESLLTLNDDDLREYAHVQAMIIKPTIQHGLSGALGLARLAYEIGATPVISSSFESGVGLRALYELAAVVNEMDTAVGLDTYKWLARDVQRQSLPVHRAAVNIDALAAEPIQLVSDV